MQPVEDGGLGRGAIPIKTLNGRKLIYQIGHSGILGFNKQNDQVRMGIDLPLDGFVLEMLSEVNYDKLKNLVANHIHSDNVVLTTNVLWDIRKHAVSKCYEFPKLEPDFDQSLEAWLEQSSYTTKDKDKFKAEIDEHSDLRKRDRYCKCFVKAETYPEFKYPRPIKSRTDRFKARMGPIFQGINNCLFSNLKYYIKKVPVNERAQRLLDLLGLGDRYDCTDFSSFEAHFLDCIIFAIEFPFYFWCTMNLANQHEFMTELETLTEPNRCVFRDFIIISMSRASGELNTSSGNGWSNLIILTYVARVKGAHETRQQIEGDDGIARVFPNSAYPTATDYEDLGWLCKLITNNCFSEASFCGIVADPTDLINVCDVKAYVADFGWTKQQYLDANERTLEALIRAKGYSAIYQYPGCPIIDSLGHYALRITEKSVVHNKMMKMYRRGHLADSRYKNQRFEAIFNSLKKIPPRKEAPMNTRLLVEKLFNISIQEQIEAEKYLDSLNAKQTLKFTFDVPEVWRYTFETFVDNVPLSSTESQFQELQNYLKSMGIID